MSEVYVASGHINIDVNGAIDAFNRVDNQANNTSRNLSNVGDKFNAFGNKLSSLGNKFSLAVTAPLAAAGTASFNLASDLNENLNKTEVVFDKNSQAVEEWSKGALKNMGMCQSSALEMASKFGDMGKSMGLSSTQVKDYSMNLSQLAGDLASFKNISIEQANTALTGVYTGETEALKGLGIVMTQTNLQEFARSQGIKKKIQDMTQAEQVQLRYNYVMAKTKDAQGDFARTSDQAANAGRTFKESTKELGATIGNNLLPIFTPWINKANEIIQKFSSMDSGTQKLIVNLGLFLIAIGPVLKIFGSLSKAIGTTSKVILGMPGAIKKGVKGLQDFGKATRDGTNLIGKFGKGIVSATKSVANFTLELIKSVGKSLASFGKAILNCIKSVLSFTKEIIKNTAMAVKNGAIWVANKVKLVAYKTAQVAVTVATKAMTVAQKALNLAMSMNPIALVITLLLGLAAVFVTLYNKCDWFRNGVNNIWSTITSIFTKFDNFLTGIFTTDWSKSFGTFGNIINAFMKNVSNVWNSIKRIFSGIIDFITGVFTGNWSRAWQGVVNIFCGIMDGLGAVIKAPLNAVIGLINSAISGINSISFTVPDWIPGVGGKHFGVSLPTISYLYTGAVFDQPTLLGNTVVGDKFKGQGNQREYVLPEPMIRQVVSEEVTKAISHLGIYLDGREVGRCLAKYKDEMEGYSNQLSPFKMG
ncbi:hypothetical protein [Clostridium perfringens]|uniref:hypothetical protein n=1 Tax=Clostridium perfringens TaxID=1502 RepID=UPI00096A9BAC|nr:hypothetical protein [Clostridium perfringens]